MLNFGQKVEEKSGDIIPKNTLLWAVINIREIKNSQETNGRYLDIELTIADNQPYARRKVWTKICDPFDANNSDAWRAMGYGAIRRILEAVKGATPDNANSYALNHLQDLHNLMVPIFVTEEKGKDGYDDKNNCEFLSPYSSVKKIVESYNLLRAGTHLYGKAPSAPPITGAPSVGGVAGISPPPGSPTTPAAGAPAPGWLADTVPAVAHALTMTQPAFTPGQLPAQGQLAAPMAPAGNAAYPQPASAPPTAPAAAPTTTSPSNTWQPPAAGTPAQFPGGAQ